MQPVTLKITIDRAAAILAGKAAYGDTTVTVDPSTLTADQRDELATLREGDILRPVSHGIGYGYATPIVDPTPEVIAKALDEHRASRLAYLAKRAADKAKDDADRRGIAEARIREWIARPVSGRVSYSGREYTVGVPGWALSGDIAPDLLRAYEAAKAEAEAEAKRQTAARLEREAAEREAASALAKRKTAALADFVADCCSDVQRKRRAAGLMPDSEVLDLVRDHVFAALNNMPRYERMTSGDFADADHVKFRVEDATRATDAQFVVMESVKAAIPGCSVQLREHMADITSDYGEDTTEFRRSYLVTVDWNGWALSREYAD